MQYNFDSLNLRCSTAFCISNRPSGGTDADCPRTTLSSEIQGVVQMLMERGWPRKVQCGKEQYAVEIVFT